MAVSLRKAPHAAIRVGGDANVNVLASQDITALGTALFWVANGNYQNLAPEGSVKTPK